MFPKVFIIRSATSPPSFGLFLGLWNCFNSLQCAWRDLVGFFWRHKRNLYVSKPACALCLRCYPHRFGELMASVCLFDSGDASMHLHLWFWVALVGCSVGVFDLPLIHSLPSSLPSFLPPSLHPLRREKHAMEGTDLGWFVGIGLELMIEGFA